MDFHDEGEKLKEQEYNMKCMVHRVPVSYFDPAYERNETAHLVVLEPYEGQARDMFYRAYYAEAYPVDNAQGGKASKIELPVYLGSPIGMFGMARLQWPNEYFKRPHLLVMSMHLEDLLNNNKNVSAVDLRVYPMSKLEEMGVTDGRMRV